MNEAGGVGGRAKFSYLWGISHGFEIQRKFLALIMTVMNMESVLWIMGA